MIDVKVCFNWSWTVCILQHISEWYFWLVAHYELCTVKYSWPISLLRMAYCMFGNRTEWKCFYSYSTGGMESKSKVAAVDMRRRAAALNMFHNYYTSCFYRLRKQELPVEVRSQSSVPKLSCAPGLISNCLLSWDPPPTILLSGLTSVSRREQTFCIWHCVDQWGFLSSLSWPFGISSVSILCKWCRELLSRWSLDCWCIYKAIRYKGNFIQRLNYTPIRIWLICFRFKIVVFII